MAAKVLSLVGRPNSCVGQVIQWKLGRAAIRKQVFLKPFFGQNRFLVPARRGDAVMKKLFIAVVAGALFCTLAIAQDTTSPSTSATPQTQPSQNNAAQPAQSAQPAQTSSEQANAANTKSLHIAPGSVIPVQLVKGVDAKKAKTGDEVDARVTQDLKSGSGELLVPKDTKVIGHVTEAQARNKEQRESQVAITFDHAVMKNGQDVSLPMSIQAIISPQALNPGSNSADSAAPQSSGAGSAGSPASGSGAGGARTGAGAAPGMSQQQSPMNTPPSGQSGGGASQPPITANTQGIVGISDMKLSAAGEANQGSVVSSEKNNVKLENGTLMLLRVNQ
jgi:hypothetical protein